LESNDSSGSEKKASPFTDASFIVIFIAVMVAMVGLGVVGPLMPVYANELGATGVWIGLIYSVFSMARATFNVPIGMLSDRKGRKRFLVAGMALYMVLSIFYIFATNVQELVAIRFFHGLGNALIIPAGLAYVGDLAPKGQEGEYMGTFNVAIFMGFGLGPLIGGVLSDLWGYASVFYLMGGMSLFALILTIFFVTPTSPEVRTRTRAPMKIVIKNKTVQALFIWRMVNALGRGCIIAFLAIYAVFEIGLTMSEVGLLLALNLLLMSVLQNPFGKLADRISRPALVIIGNLLSLGALVMIPFARSFVLLLLINVCNGTGGAMSMPAATALNTEVGRTLGMGNLMGIFSTAMSVGMIFGPVLAGVVYDVMAIDWVFWVGGIIMVFGTILFAILIRNRENEDDKEPS
jgi:MFS family permease